MQLRILLPFVLPTLLAGCLAIDENKYKIFEDPDGGSAGVDLVETCGDMSAVPLTSPRSDILIDTRGANNSTTSCGGVGTGGNDLFLALELQAGEYWHFHLAVDPSDPNAAGRNPLLYIMPAGSCGAVSCGVLSNRCANMGDEHFAFIAPSNGVYFLGIDDGVPGGALYTLQVLRPFCGDGDARHGEACDDGMHCEDGTPCDPNAPVNACVGIGNGQCEPRDGDGCDRRCRAELETSGTMERDTNDNVTEANVLRTDLPSANPFYVSGTIGGEFNCYPDVFSVKVQQGQTITVTSVVAPAGVNPEIPCGVAANTPYTFLLSNNGAFSAQSSDDANGCPSVSQSNLSAGEYYVTVDALPGTLTQVPYWLKVEVTN